MPRLKEIRANLLDRMQEAKDHGWLGEVAAIEASLAAADRKLEAMSAIAARHTVTHLGMLDFRTATGRSTPEPDLSAHPLQPMCGQSLGASA